MRLYETTFVINPHTDDATIEDRIKTVVSTITNNSGKIVHEDHMGTRRLAYPIQKLTQGFYGSFIFQAEPEALPPLDKLYREDESYIRHLTIIFEGTVEDIEKEKEAKAQPVMEERQPAPARPIGQRRPEAAPAAKPEPAVKPEPVAEPTPEAEPEAAAAPEEVPVAEPEAIAPEEVPAAEPQETAPSEPESIPEDTSSEGSTIDDEEDEL
jgi:small subunit ribosomal protein S6